MRTRRKPNLAARIERCAHLLVTQPEALRGKWLCGSEYSELHLELGCGKGSFTVETAKSYPDVLFAALEKTANVLIIALERTAREGLGNVRFLCANADEIMGFFSSGEVSRIYLNFCDPWPAARHTKRRLTDQRYLELYRQVLQVGGEIHFKTDNLPLFEYSLLEFERSGFTLHEEARDLHGNGPVGVMTDYELRFHALGKPIYKCIAQSTNAVFDRKCIM